ncbi:MAG: DUF4290 domain-containing protein [Saprospiraceae bacterium]|nr:DUF4290 domain-containing protein [Saprospiraceae bacterium]
MDRILDMEYNAEKEKLKIPEYGRNIQNLIYHAKTIEDQKEQQIFIEEIVELMKKMKIGNKVSPEYKDKIWIHVYKIADYELTAIPPNGIIPEPKPADFKPEKLNYPTSEKHFRHYGHFIHSLIDKAIELEPSLKKDQFVALIGAYMKLAYKTWNPDHYVNDKIIMQELYEMSNKQLTFPDGYSIDMLLDKEKLNGTYSSAPAKRRTTKRKITKK